MIKSIHLENFGAFENLKMRLSPGINVIIGENGTGKTILLKAIYAIAHSCHMLQDKKHSKNPGEIFSSKLLRIFLPSENDFKALRFRGSQDPIKILANTWRGNVLSAESKHPHKAFQFNFDSEGVNEFESPIFLPVKDIFSLGKILKGKKIPSDLKKVFDDTYFDIANFIYSTQNDNDSKLVKIDPLLSIIRNLADMTQGVFVWDDSKLVFQKGNYGLEIAEPPKAAKNSNQENSYEIAATLADSFKVHESLAADGHKKISTLVDIIIKFLTKSHGGGIFIWDEPESTINPKYMENTIAALTEIAKAGNQVILASHDKIIIEWLRILDEQDKHRSLSMHNLSIRPNSRVKVQSTKNYSDIMGNSIDEGILEMGGAKILKSRRNSNASR